MGIIISLIATIKEVREQRKANKIAQNYSTQPGPDPQLQSHSNSQVQTTAPSGPQPQRPPQGQAEPQEQASDSQQQQLQEERDTESHYTPGAAQAQFPATAAGIPAPEDEPPSQPAQAQAQAQAQSPPASQPDEDQGDAKMATDEDYMAFLDKANADPSAGIAKTTTAAGGQGVQTEAVDPGVEIPAELRAATDKGEWVYVSDADEPFVPVSLRLEGESLPDEETFAGLIHHPDPSKAEIEILDPVQWDSKGRYKAVVEATRKACAGGDVRVYRVSLGGTRVEYWVVGVDGSKKGKEHRLVGVKALAVES